MFHLACPMQNNSTHPGAAGQEAKFLSQIKGSSLTRIILGEARSSRAALSIFVFGLYLVILGGIFILAPNVLLSLVSLPTTQEIWIRLVGFLLLVLSFYYIMAGRTNTRAFFQWTLYTRLIAIFFLVGFVVSDLISPLALLFWLGDLAGALWTWRALRLDDSSMDSQPAGNSLPTR